MTKIKLEYGMKVLFSARPVMMVPILGIALTSSSDKYEIEEFTIGKYWEDDTDANVFKVKLYPRDSKRFGRENLYSSDLKRASIPILP